MRSFYLNRKVDISAISGTGKVAEGVIFSNGQVVMRWLTDISSIVIHESIENVMKIHCHNGASEIVYMD
jgi:hypothetical protein